MKQKIFINKGVYALVLLAVMAVAAITGCGSDDDGGTTAANSGQADNGAANGGNGTGNAADGGDSGGSADGQGSKAQFIKEADAICAKAYARTGKEANAYFEREVKNDADEAKLYEELTIDVMIPRLEERIQGVRALSTPLTAEEAASAMIAALERVRDVAEANPARFQSTSGPSIAKMQATASRYGFSESGCADFLG